ncbi:hypothetical protein N7U49_00105 [Streptomyces sp. AD2-2]|nr:hypothetical protein N7U49_00105 [Streptomyces sp. AD2-2]
MPDSGCKRQIGAFERHPRNYLAFLGLAAAFCCYKRFVRPPSWAMKPKRRRRL